MSLYFVLNKTNAHTTLARIYGEPYAHKFCAVDNCWNITRRPFQVPLRVRVRFHDSVGDIDFYQMSLSQSESTMLHESVIYDLSDEYNFTLRYTKKCI